MRVFRGASDVRAQPGFQAHHVLPVAVFSGATFGNAFGMLRVDGFDPRYFNINGLLLPATEQAALDTGRPLHRGPHRRYNAVVFERVSSIICEMDRRHRSDAARADAVQRLDLLISALRRCLSGDRDWIFLNSRDPMHSNAAFHDLDGAIDLLWLVTK